jgi:hypothetical protein
LIQTSINFPENRVTQQYAEYASADFFPKQLSATDIETLIRTPYNFYVKKILNLKAERELENTPPLSEFGNFFHKVVELYTKNYEPTELINCNKFNTYARKLLNDSIFPKQTQNLWQLKISAISQEFVLFDNERRNNGMQIFSEVRGEIILDINGTKIKIIAIADRIEINKEKNKAIIIDYKTGKVDKNTVTLSTWTALTDDIANEKIIQILAYAFMYEELALEQPMEAGIISFKNLKSGFLPFTFKEGKELNTIISKETINQYLEQIAILLVEIFDQNIPFEEKV